ncbi:MAG: ATP-grasp domain-containing protein [Bacteroidetes bacterium]|nr:MAG: ATP-grasp domain-containing protein [Bacteroidota bacterium]
MSKPVFNIALTGLNAIDSPGSGSGVIRSLREPKDFDVRIIGLAYENLEPCIYMPHLVDKTYRIPYPSEGQEALLERLRYIHAQENLHIIFPNFDSELYNFIKLEKKLADEMQIKMLLPTLEQFESRHKAVLYEFGEKAGIKVPKAKPVFSAMEIAKIAYDFRFPLVVKGKYYEAAVTYTIEQAQQHFHKISAKWGLPILLQEFVHGTELNVCGIGDGKGNLLGAVSMRKLYITDKGKAWAGITIDDDELTDLTQKFVEKSHWKGGFELEIIRNGNGEYYLLEINPRFPAWSYLTTGAGQNQAALLVNMAMGLPYEPFTSYEVGKMFIRFSEDMVVDLQDFEKISTFGEK